MTHSDTAAAQRRNRLLPYADEIERLLDRVPETGTGHRAMVAAALPVVRGNPVDPAVWSQASGPARFARDWAYTQRPEAAQLWERLHDAARQGAWMAHQMAEIAAAGVPLCEAHGPMTDAEQCPQYPGCTSPYRALDGTRFVRGRGAPRTT